MFELLEGDAISKVESLSELFPVCPGLIEFIRVVISFRWQADSSQALKRAQRFPQCLQNGGLLYFVVLPFGLEAKYSVTSAEQGFKRSRKVSEQTCRGGAARRP